jgi:hypothetical protein
MIETPEELASFCNPDEFGDSAFLIQVGGEELPIAVIVDNIADQERPGATSGSTRGSNLVGAADVGGRFIQAYSTFAIAAGAVPNRSQLRIETGVYAGLYRIQTVSHDGDVTIYRLNKI